MREKPAAAPTYAFKQGHMAFKKFAEQRPTAEKQPLGSSFS